MNRHLKRVLGLLGCFCAFFGLLAVLGIWWFTSNRDKMRDPDEELELRVAAIAPSGPEACFYEALTWKNDRGPLLEEVESESFFFRCLKEAAIPEDYCEEVPLPEEIAQSRAWARVYCESQSTRAVECQELAETIQQFCSAQ